MPDVYCVKCNEKPREGEYCLPVFAADGKDERQPISRLIHVECVKK